MSADLLKQLLRAYVNHDADLFRKSALQIAANESKIGHSKLAEEIREIITKLPEAADFGQNPISIAQPRGELGDLIEGGFRKESIRDIILDEPTRNLIGKVILENRKRSTLQQYGVAATRRLLFFGPPGCGKTLAAQVLAGELGLPLMTVRFDSLFSKYLGATAGHLRTIFHEMPRRPAVYLFDEFDALGKQRDDADELGEIKRVVSSFLQMMDSDKSNSLIIAATNFEKVIDRALVRRFDAILQFHLPSSGDVATLIESRLSNYKPEAVTIKKASTLAKGLSFADVARACDDAIRAMALDERKRLSNNDILGAFSTLAERAKKLSLNNNR